MNDLLNTQYKLPTFTTPSHATKVHKPTVTEKLINNAKSALSLNMSAVKCLATDLYPDVANHCQHLLQAKWDGCISNKLIYLHVSGNILD